jgi:hypothetical protein
MGYYIPDGRYVSANPAIGYHDVATLVIAIERHAILAVAG